MSTEEISEGRKVILGLIASQRRLGNSELFVKEISRNIPVGHELRLVRLPTLNILPCNGCYRCIGEGRCAIEDDIPFLLQQISSCDALIVASPVYFLGAHASIKRVIDRSFSFYATIEKSKRKPCILANMYGMEERIGTAPQALLTLATFLCLEVKASVNVKAALPGDVLINKNHLRMAARLGSVLFGERRKKADRGCPFCGNEIVRMKKDRFICTLCHGSFYYDQRGRIVEGPRGWDVGDIGFIRSHREWLKGMKKKFLTNRKEMLRLTSEYKDMGQWVEPE